MKQKVVIIGHSYTSRLGLIRSLAELDCEITVVAMVFHNWFGRMIRMEGGKPIDCCSKFVDRVLYCHVQDGEGLISLLLDKCADSSQKVILIPDSDFAAAAIDDNQERLKESFLFPHIDHSPGAVRHWMDKTVQKDLARKIGLDTVDGRIVSVVDRQYAIPEGVNFPCFTKALATISGGKQFLRRCDNEAQLRSVLDKVSLKYNTQVLVEDYKPINAEYAVVGFSDGSNVVIPGVIEFIANSNSHFGIAREGLVRPTCGFEDLLEKFRGFVRQIGFCGLFDIDFYESEGKLFFSEMNLRFGGSGYACTAMGANLPAIFVRYLRGEDYHDLIHNIDRNATYVNERMCLDDYLSGHITWKECLQIIKRSEIRFVFDEQDAGPQRKFRKYCNYVKLNRMRKRIRISFNH